MLFGGDNEFGEGDVVLLTEAEARPFLDLVEPVVETAVVKDSNDEETAVSDDALATGETEQTEALDAEQMALIEYVKTYPKATYDMIARALKISKSKVGGIVNGLRDDGVLERTTNGYVVNVQ